MKKIAVLGSTGSVGENTMEVIRASGGLLGAVALGSGSNARRLVEQAREFRPRLVAVANPAAVEEVRGGLSGLDIEVAGGEKGMVRVATFPEAERVVSAIVGAAGIRPTYEAVLAGKDIALANKESLVAAGEVMMAALRTGGGRILPVDSEHSALFQTLAGRDPEEVHSITLTASGGPFWSLPGKDLWGVEPGDALRHPRWNMGSKVSIDSATLMNKGLEVIEAHWLFGLDLDRIRVLIHPQSIVHALVEFVDGTVMAHLSRPDMRLPIAAALHYPRKQELPWPRLDLAEAGRLEFFAPDHRRFPALDLARRAFARGGGAPAALSAANEVAVEAFLRRELSFPEIITVSGRVLEAYAGGSEPGTVEGILEEDGRARRMAAELIRDLRAARRA